jgi:hypothetical protein
VGVGDDFDGFGGAAPFAAARADGCHSRRGEPANDEEDQQKCNDPARFHGFGVLSLKSNLKWTYRNAA